MMKVKIAPSLMCSDFKHLAQEIELFEKSEVDFLHVDVMDGHFVPNITLGPPVVRAISAMTKLPLDVHMMVTHPENFIPVMCPGNNSIVTIHAEAAKKPKALIKAIREAGARPGVAINPETPVGKIEPFLELVDLVLVMTVTPGFAGQKLVPHTIEKIAELKSLLDGKGLSPLIEADGNTTFDNIRRMVEAGANVIVAGSSCLYRTDKPLAEALEEMKPFLAGL
jgi:ribulose-phosphate 3-epimerase